MKKGDRHSIVLRLLITGLTLFSGACGSSVHAVRIGDLVKSSSAHMGKEVQVEGEVTNAAQVAFVESKFFDVRDETGEILVSTKRPVPAVGTKVKVRGVVATLATFGTTSAGVYLQETQRN